MLPSYHTSSVRSLCIISRQRGSQTGGRRWLRQGQDASPLGGSGKRRNAAAGRQSGADSAATESSSGQTAACQGRLSGDRRMSASERSMGGAFQKKLVGKMAR